MTDAEPDVTHLDFDPVCDITACEEEAGWVARFGACPACGETEEHTLFCTTHMKALLDKQVALHQCGLGLAPVQTWRNL